jgi:hypothetical protein
MLQFVEETHQALAYIMYRMLTPNSPKAVCSILTLCELPLPSFERPPKLQKEGEKEGRKEREKKERKEGKRKKEGRKERERRKEGKKEGSEDGGA